MEKESYFQYHGIFIHIFKIKTNLFLEKANKKIKYELKKLNKLNKNNMN
jgi:hypothetical protein